MGTWSAAISADDVACEGVFTVACRWTRVGLRWIDADTLEIAYPATARVDDREDETFFYGRTIKLVYRPENGGSP